MIMDSQIIRVGDSYYTLIPKTLFNALKLKEKQAVIIRVEGNLLTIEVKGNPFC